MDIYGQDRMGTKGGQGAEAKAQRPSFVHVDLGAIGRNTQALKRRISEKGDCLLMAVVKADGYGHGLLPVSAQALAAGADWLGVSLPQEALELRDAGIEAPVLVMGSPEPESYRHLIEADVRQTIFTLAQGAAMADAAHAVGGKAKVHLKIDTGMGRIGFWPGDAALEDIVTLASMDALEMEGCFTHYARADEDDDGSWRGQYGVFQDFLERLAARGVDFPLVHSANTAAGIREGGPTMDMVRAGIGIYGMYPSADAKSWDTVALEPALCWKSVLSHVKPVPKGYSVSYGHTWTAEKDSLVGTVPVGYADGYSRGLSNRGWVLVRGRKAPVIGNVCMDQFMVDLEEVPDAQAGDEVILIGSQGAASISADDIAERIGTINYEVVCGISARIPRIYGRSEAR